MKDVRTERASSDDAIANWSASVYRSLLQMERQATGMGNEPVEWTQKELDQVFQKNIHRLFDEEDWKGAIQALRRRLRYEPRNHWVLTRLCTAYYEQRNYRRALHWSNKAMTLAPNCPLVLWDNAGCLDMLGRDDEAIRIYRRLLRRGIRRIANDQCGEGLPWARSLRNDCRYCVALCLRDMGDLRGARRWFESYLRRRGRGTRSIYTVAEVRQKHRKVLADLAKESRPTTRSGSRSRKDSSKTSR